MNAMINNMKLFISVINSVYIVTILAYHTISGCRSIVEQSHNYFCFQVPLLFGPEFRYYIDGFDYIYYFLSPPFFFLTIVIIKNAANKTFITYVLFILIFK